jgi:hypothetical protein
MCEACDALTTEATVQVMLAAAERELILAQTDAGESVPHATRPLSAAEKRAKMRFGEIDKLESDAADKAAKLLASNAQVYIMAIIGAIFGDRETADPDQVVDAFDRLSRGEMPAAVAGATDKLTGSIAAILAAVYGGASHIALGEAARQKVPNLPDPLTAKPERFTTLARAVALHPWTRLTTKLQSDMLTPASLATPFAKADVEATLKAIPLDGAEDLARQSINAAHGQGRLETIAPLQPTRNYSSELLDGQTCSRCAAVDGNEYDTLEDALAEYETGGYGACLGGSRCRGLIISVYGYAG